MGGIEGNKRLQPNPSHPCAGRDKREMKEARRSLLMAYFKKKKKGGFLLSQWREESLGKGEDAHFPLY